VKTFNAFYTPLRNYAGFWREIYFLGIHFNVFFSTRCVVPVFVTVYLCQKNVYEFIQHRELFFSTTLIVHFLEKGPGTLK
jgi:hypothetical protein